MSHCLHEFKTGTCKNNVTSFKKNILLTLLQAEAKTQGINDQMLYKEVRRAMEVIQLSLAEQKEMFTIVASVLHLGNAGFMEEDGKASLTDTTATQLVSQVS